MERARKIHGSIVDLVGHTPIIRLNRLSRETGCELLIKAEFLNPGGSIKDRVARAMLGAAELSGRLQPGALVVEATAGNTGVALALLAAARGYRFVAVLSEADRSNPKVAAMHSYGAEVVFAPADAPWDSERGPLGIARRLASERDGLFLNQFANPSNPDAHALGTALEILDDLGTDLDVVVAGIGSGGTATGLARTLKPSIPRLRVVGVAAEASYLASAAEHGNGRIPGITPDFEPPVFARELLDGVSTVDPATARARARQLAIDEGLWVGESTGATVEIALREARELTRATLLAIAADTGRNTPEAT